MPADTRLDATLTIDFKASGFDDGGTAHIPITWAFTSVKQEDVAKMEAVLQVVIMHLMNALALIGGEKIGPEAEARVDRFAQKALAASLQSPTPPPRP